MNRRLKQISLLAIALGLASVLTGCGGFSSSRSVSPASFLLPGLVNENSHPEPDSSLTPVATEESHIS